MDAWLQAKIRECGLGLRPRLNASLCDAQRRWGGLRRSISTFTFYLLFWPSVEKRRQNQGSFLFVLCVLQMTETVTGGTLNSTHSKRRVINALALTTNALLCTALSAV